MDSSRPIPAWALLIFACLPLLLSGCGDNQVDPSTSTAAHTHEPGMTHSPGMTHPAGSAWNATEPGQAAFAAVQEIVAFLESDPATDWSRVNITALRDHLADMDTLFLHANVTQRKTATGFEADVAGPHEVAAAAWRMVPEHVQALAGREGWNLTVTAFEGGLTLHATGSSPSDVAMLQGLGFYGVMATDSHHPLHHEAIALDNPMMH